MQTTTYEDEKNLKDYLKLNHFETFTYDKLLELKEDIDKNIETDIPIETVKKIDSLIERKKNEISSLKKLDDLGYSLYESGNAADVYRSKTSRKSDIWAIIIGLILTPAAFSAFYLIFSFLFKLNEEDFTFSTFFLLSMMLFAGGTGIILMTKGIIRRKMNISLIISSDLNNIIYIKNKQAEKFEKHNHKFDRIVEGSKHKIILKSSNGDFFEKDILEFEFTNKAYHETVDLLISKLNA